MQVALSQQNYIIGHFEANHQKMATAIEQAIHAGADLIAFTELSVCGYPPRDFLEFGDFIQSCNDVMQALAKSYPQIGILAGTPVPNPRKEGKDLHNAVVFLFEGKVQQTFYKTLLPTYDVFDEYRYFEPGNQWDVLSFKGKKIAVTICEDIWNLGDNPLYTVCPMDELMPQQPDLMINLSASPFDYDHDDDRKAVVRANVLKYGLPMLYVNTVGSQTEIVFDGGSLVYNQAGELIHEGKYFEEDLLLVDVDRLYVGVNAAASKDERLGADMRLQKTTAPASILQHLTAVTNIAQIHQALILGIKDYFAKLGFTKAILGSSGGIDSAVVLALACEALGPQNVQAILMPSQYSSDHSVKDAIQLSENLGNPHAIIPIEPIYKSFESQLAPMFKGLPFGLAEENMQSRTRGNLLMSIANKFGFILLNTSNKSELCTGYGTLYGDMAGGISVIGDLYKMQVYALANYINRDREIIPQHILEKAPSAELRPGQKDSDSLPDYSELDTVLFQYIEQRKGPKEIIASGFPEALVKRAMQLVNTNEYKRNQFCPIIRVSCKAFGVGRRVPIVAHYLNS